MVTLTHIPRYLPEITIGAHEYDEMYTAYKSVGGDDKDVFLSWFGVGLCCCYVGLSEFSYRDVFHAKVELLQLFAKSKICRFTKYKNYVAQDVEF